ncbi:hypothetical protein P4V64_32060, partial [Bacillus thuringiensis]|nr:hypothetical protein [Bacillus thuringiensis]
FKECLFYLSNRVLCIVRVPFVFWITGETSDLLFRTFNHRPNEWWYTVDTMSLLKILFPIVVVSIILFLFWKQESLKKSGTRIAVPCTLKRKEIQISRNGISPQMKNYLMVFEDDFGNNIEVEIRNKRTFNTLIEGNSGELIYISTTPSISNQFVDFTKKNHS